MCGIHNAHLLQGEAAQQRSIVKVVARIQQQVRAASSIAGGGCADAGKHHARQPHQMLHTQT